MAKFRVIGAGFSGLIAAYELVRRGHEVVIYEKQNHVGGLIRTLHNDAGPVETAANGVLNTLAFEKLCHDLNVPLVATQKQSKKRFIFRNSLPKRWPLRFSSSMKLLWGFSRVKKPKAGETIAEWGRRNFDQEAVDYLLSPALQGIYAGDVDQMSASLILNRFFLKQRKARPLLRGLVSPANGMGQLMEALKAWLVKFGVEFHLNHNISSADLTKENLSSMLIATNASGAAELLKVVANEDSEILKKIEMLPLVRATLFFKEQRKLNGFGCLFPKTEKFNSLGVLFDDSIFNRAHQNTTESWILGGAMDRSIHLLSDDQLLQKIAEDRSRLLKSYERPFHFVMTRWPTALPHYTIQMEALLNQLSPEVEGHLVGNYLGKIGLSQMIEQAQNKVAKFLEHHI